MSAYYKLLWKWLLVSIALEEGKENPVKTARKMSQNPIFFRARASRVHGNTENLLPLLVTKLGAHEMGLFISQ